MERVRDRDESTTFTADGDTLFIRGEIDVAVADEFTAAINALLDANPGVPVRINLQDVSFIDSSGLGVLVGANKRASELGSAIRLENVQDSPAKVFEITGLRA
ncbi:MAG: STAS domain-containing protein, partial [Acidimicrobiia bacterium]